MEPANVKVRTKLFIFIASAKWFSNDRLNSNRTFDTNSPAKMGYIPDGYGWDEKRKAEKE